MNTKIYDIYKSAGILIKNRKLLVEKSTGREFYVAPGGKIEGDETPKQALVRELLEEFYITTVEADFAEFGTFYADAAGNESKVVRMDVFIVKNWEGEPQPNSEVEKIMWIDSNIPKDIKVGSIFEKKVIPRLKEQDLID